MTYNEFDPMVLKRTLSDEERAGLDEADLRVYDIIRGAPQKQISGVSVQAILVLEDIIEAHQTIVDLLRKNMIEAVIQDESKEIYNIENYVFRPFVPKEIPDKSKFSTPKP